MSDILEHVHVTHEGVASLELTPPHPPREETPAYRKSHQYLVETRDMPCQACGVRTSTLGNPHENPFGARVLETHHFPIERSLMDAVDPHKVHTKFPQVMDQETLETFIDSPANLIVLCDQCHRSPQRGIHHLLPQDWFVLPFLLDRYIVVASLEEEAQALATDEQIEEQQQKRCEQEGPTPQP